MRELTVFSSEGERVVRADEGEVLGDVLSALDLPLERPCGGLGFCGSCKVLVERGGSEVDEIEQGYLSEAELALGIRLACRVRVQGNMRITLFPVVVYSNKIFQGSTAYLKEREVPLGLAVDLGTTTVAVYLVRLDTGEVVAGGATLNQQSIYGADVISRISAALKSDEHRQRLHRLAVSSINQAIESLYISNMTMERVRRAVIVGNAPMHHLLAGLPVESLSRLPFQPCSTEPMPDVPDVLDGILPDTIRINLPPLVGGFVGSDALACLAYFGFDASSGPQLAIDLGTNGEVLLTDGDRVLAASTAAGPAFEGVNISCGMRAEDGAVVGASLQDGELVFETIGGTVPVGLSGSGLLQLVSVLLKSGVIEPSGKFVHPPPVLADQLVSAKGGRSLYLNKERKLWLSQKDIRELQKAKGAIRAAVEILMNTLKLSPSDLGQVILTGSFGGELDIESVLALGLIPAVPVEKVRGIPNGAGLGAAMFLSEQGFAQGEKLARQAGQIDLDQHPDFQDIYIKSLTLSN